MNNISYINILMKYFNEYKKYENEKIGIITVLSQENAIVKCLNENVNITSKLSINRALNNDTVAIVDNNVTRIIERNEIIIPGFIILNDKQKYGINKKNNPIYLFKSLLLGYPNVLVSSNIAKKYKDTNKIIYILVKITNWETDKLYPNGICEKIIGESGNKETDIMIRVYYNNLLENNKKFKIDKINVDIDLNKIRDIRNLYTISIDPPNCLDIDDAISVLQLKQDHYRIGVHIADVTSFFELSSSIDKEAFNRSFTVYLPDTQIPIIPIDLAHNECSLLPNKDRLTLSCFFDWEQKNASITNIIFEQCLINSNAALTYNNVDKLMIPDQFKKDLSILEKITNTKQDSHKLIEKLMILVNTFAAEKIEKLNCDKIFRIQDGLVNNSNWLENVIKSKPATYITSNTSTSINKFHSSINTKCYTHFTSPIRRYTDQIIHRLIKNEKLNINFDKLVNHLNKQQIKHKKFKRDLDLLNFIYSDISVINKPGIIMPFRYSNKNKDIKIDIAIPELKLIYPLRIITNNLSNIFSISIKDNILTLQNKQNNSFIQIKEFQEIDISLFKFPKEPLLFKKCVLHSDIFQNFKNVFN
jgi:exoribonuclease R